MTMSSRPVTFAVQKRNGSARRGECASSERHSFVSRTSGGAGQSFRRTLFAGSSWAGTKPNCATSGPYGPHGSSGRRQMRSTKAHGYKNTARSRRYHPATRQAPSAKWRQVRRRREEIAMSVIEHRALSRRGFCLRCAGAAGLAARLPALILFICLTGVHAMAADGLITVRSNHDPNKTVNRLEAEVKAKGLAVFAHVDHAAGAAEVGLPLRATSLLIFG